MNLYENIAVANKRLSRIVRWLTLALFLMVLTQPNGVEAKEKTYETVMFELNGQVNLEQRRPLPTVRVEVFSTAQKQESANPVWSTMTDNRGFYHISGIAPACYVVQFTAPEGTTFDKDLGTPRTRRDVCLEPSNKAGEATNLTMLNITVHKAKSKNLLKATTNHHVLSEPEIDKIRGESVSIDEAEINRLSNQSPEDSKKAKNITKKAKGQGSEPRPLIRFDDGAISIGEVKPASEQLPLIASVNQKGDPQSDLDLVNRLTSEKPVSQENDVVLGDDDRSRATPTDFYPRDAIVQIENDDALCSGVLVGADKVVTAAHCVFDNQSDEWIAGPWRVQPARDGPTANSSVCRSVTKIVIPSEYEEATDEINPETDTAVMKLGCSYPGTEGNGFYPVVALPENSFQYPTDGLYLVGYPEEVNSNTVLGQQWEDSGRLIVDPDYLKTVNVDASKGQSGGLWAVPCEEYGWYYCMVGNHVGSIEYRFAGMNTGFRFTERDVARINDA